MSKIENIKNHVRENKKAYVIGGTVAAVGVVGGVGYFLGVRSVPKNVEALAAPANVQPIQVGAFNYKSPLTMPVTIELVERSTRSRPVHLVGSNLYFNSLNEAARETGHSLSMLSRHVNGHIPDVGGDVFELLEVAT